MSKSELAEATAVTKPSVTPGLGYPANRIEESPEPTGWQHTVETGEFANVSRETMD
jgi:hypothetical protein